MERGTPARLRVALGLVLLAMSGVWLLLREQELADAGPTATPGRHETREPVAGEELERTASLPAREASAVVASAPPQEATSHPSPTPGTATVRVRVVPPPGIVLSEETRERSDVHVHASGGPRFALPEDLVVMLRDVELEGGTRFIACRVPGFIARTERVALRAGLETELTIELDGGNRIRGRVEDETGEPLEGVSVSVQTWNESAVWNLTDALGRFDLSGIPPGRTSLSAWTRHRVEDGRELGELAPGTEIDGLVLVLRRGEAIGGRVFLPDGRPAVGAEVEAESAEDESEWTRTAADGSFLMQGLSQGVFHVRAWLPLDDVNEDDEYERPADDWLRPRVQALEIPSGTRDLELRLEVPTELEVELVGGPGGWPEVWNLDGTPAWADPRSVWGDPGDPCWEFEHRTPSLIVLRGLPRGDYWLAVKSAIGQRVAIVRIERESSDGRVVASLSDGTWVELSRNVRVHGETGFVLREDSSLSFGAFLMPPGTHRAEWDEGGIRRELTFTLAGEETFDLAAEMEHVERSTR